MLEAEQACSSPLSGTLPSQLAALTRLSQLGLYDNSLSGTLPSQLAALTRLSYSACLTTRSPAHHSASRQSRYIRMEIVSGNFRCLSISNCGFPALTKRL